MQINTSNIMGIFLIIVIILVFTIICALLREPHGARTNPNPLPYPNEIYTDDINKAKQNVREDYIFYVRALRVLYNKPKLREPILKTMHELENTRYYIPPNTGSSF